MNAYQCQPTRNPLDAVVTVPGSKSITNRALIIAALADGDSLLDGALLAEDTRLMMEALHWLGIAVTIDESASMVEVTGCGGGPPAEGATLFCGNAGTVLRFCTAFAALGHGEFELDGIGRLRERPIGALGGVLRSLGTGIEYEGRDGFPPIVVHASGLRGGQVSFDSPDSSQMVSALLLVAPYAHGDVLIEVEGKISSVPFLKMTTALMEQFGVAVIEQYTDGDARFIVEAMQRYEGRTLSIEPDATSASYFLGAPAVVGGRVTVEGIGTDSLQGDVRFVDVLERMGCTVERESTRLTVIGPPERRPLHGIDVDLNDMPDTALTLAVLALFADGPTTIRNVASLRVKETDRIEALSRELTKFGATVEASHDGLRITPNGRIKPAVVDTYDDHRMAMSFAMAGLACEGVSINDPECCNKTFPDFFDRLECMARSG